MLTARRRYDYTQRNYIRQLYETYGQVPENHAKAIKLRMDFFRKYVLERSTTDYQTDTEKDWTYIARREYRWNVTLRSLADGFAAGNVACIIRMFMAKKFVIWPMIPFGAAVYLYRQHDLFMFYNKKFFDMCNIGVQYEVGRARNEVLKECNRLLDTEDF